MLHQALALLPAAELGAGEIDLTRYLTVVGVLVALLVAVGLGLRRLASSSGRWRAGRKGLAVVEVLPLGGRRQLAVVRCYDRTFALGLGEKDVSLVAELDPVQAEAEEAPEKDGARDPFAELIGRAQRRLAAEGREAKPAPSSVRELVG